MIRTGLKRRRNNLQRRSVSRCESVNPSYDGLPRPSIVQHARDRRPWKAIVQQLHASALHWIPPILSILVWLPAASTLADEQVDFGRRIRPLLAEKCFSCHGLDEANRETDLRFDTKDGLFAEVESGGFAVVPGNSAESAIYTRLVAEDEDERMPPPDARKRVSPEEIDLIKRWIDQGAPWQQHWSLVTPVRASVPIVRDAKWPRTEVDHFILARLDQAGLNPSPAADQATLIRRVTFDLTGLPPTLQEIDDFLADHSAVAYEHVVDRLLKSPRFGEHMARYWLDAARYADTHGLHLDNFRQMWPYRDWVIQAFNSNMPFDQFTIEQLAGDLLPHATLAQKVATGFSRCNVTTSEGGVIPEEYYVHYTNDRVATMSTVWMGVSMGCVMCHEHKFDPFGMKIFINSSRSSTASTVPSWTAIRRTRHPSSRLPPSRSAPNWRI